MTRTPMRQKARGAMNGSQKVAIRLSLVVVSILLLSIFSSFGTASAASVRSTHSSHYSLQGETPSSRTIPSAIGGGCYTTGNGVVTVGACINYDGNAGNVNSDAYITIPSGLAQVPTCEVYVYMYDTGGDVIDWNNYPCRGGKNYYGPLSGWELSGDYYTYAVVEYYGISVYEMSPIQSV